MKTISFENLKNLKRREGGLSPAEVASQRAVFGPNDIVEVAGHPWLELVLETLKDPMIWFLVGIGVAFLFAGERGDAITLFVAVLPLLFMDAFLHWRTQASTATLKGQLSSVAKVLRDGREIELNSRELVPGDLVILSPGLLLPADGIFEKAADIQIDESVLTGESLPISKAAFVAADPFALAHLQESKVAPSTLGYAGTRVLTGSGLLRVLFTGARTSYGEIVQSVSRMPHVRTPLQESIGRMVRFLVFASIGFCVLLAGVRIYQGHGWLDALLSAATLAVAAIPEEFPVVFSFFLGVGVYRLAKKRALVRKAVSVENIGRTTQICTDKTGTLTLGSLKLAHTDASASEEALLRAALVASSSATDPMDLAIRDGASGRGISEPPRYQTIPFTEDRKREAGFAELSPERALVCIKGSPETVLGLSSLKPEELRDWRARVSAWAKGGHKVIGVAQMELARTEARGEPEGGYTFLGLLAFEDPVRPEVAAAMAYCRENGIRVLMVTGDHPETAVAIARDAGLVTDTAHVVSAEAEAEKFQEDWLEKNPQFLKNLHVVARCTPLQKLRVVNALKRAGELVVVTGDGVNDVPALKAADIGIAMGERGTRSAKEVSSIILADDNFRTIVSAIREGRQLFKNLRMSFEYLLLIHFPLVSVAALLPLAGYPLVFLPVHIVWLELILHPTALLAFQARAKTEREEGGERRAFFSKSEVAQILLAGLVVAFALGGVFLSGLGESEDPAYARAKAMAVLTLWSAGVAVGLTQLRSRVANGLAVLTVISSVVLIQGAQVFRFTKLAPLNVVDWAQVGAVVIGAIVGLVALKMRFPQRAR